MTASTFEANPIDGAPRRLVEDAWQTLNRVYAIGTVALLALLLLLWTVGSGPGAWRGALGPASAAGPAGPFAPPAEPPLAREPARPPAGGGAGPAANSAAAPLDGARAGAGALDSAAPGTGAPAGAHSALAGATPGADARTLPGADATGDTAGAAEGAAANGRAAVAAEAAPDTPRPVPGAPVARLFFRTDQAWPQGEVGPALAPVLAYLQAEPDALALVSGFHDRRGSAETNAALALRRAQSVRGVLIREGVAADRIMLAEPQQTQGSGPDREARRVEVTVAR